jgi:hypothetical protein
MTMPMQRLAMVAVAALFTAASALSGTSQAYANSLSPAVIHTADAAAWKYYGTYDDSATCEAEGARNSQGRSWKCVAQAGKYELYILF